MNFPENWPEIAWAKLPLADRRRAVEILRDFYEPRFFEEARALMQEHGLRDWMPPYWHMGQGMTVRNVLRRGGFKDDQLPTLPEVYSGHEVSSWDDFYVQALEAAAGMRPMHDGGTIKVYAPPQADTVFRRMRRRLLWAFA